MSDWLYIILGISAIVALFEFCHRLHCFLDRKLWGPMHRKLYHDYEKKLLEMRNARNGYE